MKNNKSNTSRNHSPTKTPTNPLLETPIAYKNWEQQTNNKSRVEVSKIIRDIQESLVRLTKNYDGKNLEEIITGIIKQKIFAYVFCPAHQPLSSTSEYCSAEWHILTACQASVIFSHPKHKVELFHKYAFGIDDLWVSIIDTGKITFTNIPIKKKVTENQLYGIKPTTTEINSLKERIVNETTQSRNTRIKEQTDYYVKKLENEFPKNKISREKVIEKIVYRFEMIAYRQLNKQQPLSKDSYIRTDRKERNKKIKKS